MTLSRIRYMNKHQLEILTDSIMPQKPYKTDLPEPPNSGDSVYSTDGLEDILMPFDARSPFELELRFTEDRGDYTFSIESPYTAGRPNSAGTESSEAPPSSHSSAGSSPIGFDLERHVLKYGSTETSPSKKQSALPGRTLINPIFCSSPPASLSTKSVEHRNVRSRHALGKPLPKPAADLRRAPPGLGESCSRQRPASQGTTSSHTESLKQRRSHSSGRSVTPILLDTILEHDQLDFSQFPVSFAPKTTKPQSIDEPIGFKSVEAFSHYFHGPPPPAPVPNYVAAALSHSPKPRLGGNSQGKLDHLLGRVGAQRLACLKNSMTPRIAETEHRLYEMI